MKNERSLAIDALRGLAVMMVVLNHAVLSAGTGVAAFDAFMEFFHRFGGHGVDIFFVLSGFCIHWAYSRADKPFDLKQYAKRRFFRIYPAYFFALGISVLLHLIFAGKKMVLGEDVPMHAFGWWQIVTHLLLIHNLFTSAIMRINGPFWTLGLEAQFYVLYPLVRRFFFQTWHWALLFVVSVGLWMLSWRLEPFGDFQPQHIFRFWLEWLIGAYAVFLYRNYDPMIHKIRWFFLALAVLMIYAVTHLNHLMPQHVHLGFAMATFCLILGLFKWEAPFAAPGFNLLPAIGFFSYSIYLLHYPILDRWTRLVPEISSNGAIRILFSFTGVILVLWISRLFFKRFEKPFLHNSQG